MSNGPQNDIYQALDIAGVYRQLFDIVRLVDAEQGKVIEYSNGAIAETEAHCVDVFGSTERCKNCTSVRALYSNQQVVKLEFVGGAVLLIVSAPVELGGRHLVAELVKNVTDSMTVDNRDPLRSNEISSIIDKFNKMAVTDALTQLMNRRFIDERLPNILLGSRLIGQPTSIAMVDIDFFKQINDHYSHQAGDTVLADLSAVLLSHIRRESDFAARYGGEEFLLCYPGITLDTCRHLCEQIRLQVEQHSFAYQGTSIPVTVSIGVAESGEVADLTQEQMVALADKRLYQAKASGRNRVV